MLWLSRYTLGAQIQAREHAHWYRGVRESDQRPVVAKLLADEYPSVKHIARLRHEYAIEAALELDGVVRPLALEQHGHGLVLIWADPGEATLRSLLSSGPLALGPALRIAASLADTLAGVHDAGVIHKHVTPEHVFVERESWRTQLCGFDIAARLSRETPLTGSPRTLEGTLAYISPEQTGRMNRNVDRRSDLYSLGIVLYELLTGAPPFVAGDVMDLLYSHLARCPEPPHERVPELPSVVSDVVMKLLEKSAEDRYQHARAVAHDLRRCLAQLDAGAPLTTFTLARDDRDHGGLLDIPQRLYGREAELRLLHEAWQRVAAGAAELLLVRGYSGIGKSVLVHEIHRELTGAHGYFVGGKFDQLGRTVPHAALATALRELVHLLLTEPESELEQFRGQLLAAVGGNAGVLTALVPDLERIIGPAPALPELSATASRSRLGRVVVQFLRVVSSGGRPLVLFLDDLQWADLASLELLEAIFKAGVNEHLLVIGAYRSNEVAASHPLTLTLRAIEATAKVSAIELGPLGRGDVLRFIADTLGSTVEVVAPLASLVQAKTEGNPFYLIQLLVALHEDGLLVYDREARAYQWDEPGVRAAAASENVLAFMTQRIERLSASTGRALELAACIGHRFELGTLATIAESSPRALADALWPAIEAGMIIPLDTDYRFLSSSDAPEDGAQLAFRFLHDRVQQAAYARIDPEQLAALHLRIGRLLLAASQPLAGADSAPADSVSFELLSHLNLGRELITSAPERISLARRNLAAGRKAQAATAYAAAHRYFAAGLSQFDAASFVSNYELAFALHLGVAEAAISTGGHEQAEDSIETLLEHARSASERAAVLDLRVVLCTSQSQSEAAIEAGCEGLRLLGFVVPDTEPAQREAYDRSLDAIAALMSGRSIEELASVPPTDAPDMRVAMKLARHTAMAAFGPSTTLGYWLSALAVELSLRHGSSPSSAAAYAFLGAVLATNTTRYAEAHVLVTLALAVHERQATDLHEACMLGFYFVTVSHFTMPWRALLTHLERAAVAGIESGDLLFLSYICSHRTIARMILGDPLDEVREDVARMLALMHKHKLAAAAMTQTVLLRTISCLQARSTGPAELQDAPGEEASMLAAMQTGRMAFALVWYRTSKAALLYLAGEHERALEQLDLITLPTAFTPEARLFTALTLLALAPANDDDTRARRTAQLERCRRDYEIWASACAANYRHRHLLIEAEVARRADQTERAAELYDQAIAAAHEHEWPRDQALAEELAAKFYLSRGRGRSARAYMNDAAYGYARWGAVAHVRALSERFPGLVPIEAQRSAKPAVYQQESENGVDEIDLLDFARSLQLIAREVLLDDVIERVMQIVLHSAGAERGALVLERDNQLVVYATVSDMPPRVVLEPGASLDEHGGLPASVVRYVARLSELVVLDDAALDERFAADPYIARVRPRSLACLAMTHQGRVRGVLYLENNAATAAFTTRRLELLGLLSSQAVISIDNSDLYARIQAVKQGLEVEVERRHSELLIANQRLTIELQERQRTEHEHARIQAARLAELSTPVIPFAREILIVPLIGSLDQQRALEISEAAVTGAHQRKASVLIMDLTGTKGGDVNVATVLASTHRMLRMLGTDVIVTGIGARLALALVDRTDLLAELTTRATLEDGVAEALERVARKKLKAESARR
jgi:predicted ATPase/anti-anti-sigma regulatory factor